jgi:hypothetical protein
LTPCKYFFIRIYAFCRNSLILNEIQWKQFKRDLRRQASRTYDLTFDGSNVNQPTAMFTVLPRTNPGAPYGSSNDPSVISTQNYQNQRTYAIQQFTQQVYVRIRGRQMAFQVSSDALGVQWQLGVPRIDIRPDGRR